MSLKCSLFGHAFGEGEVEREREEQGSEVVITIRETETCTRCGAERVVSENKEVTTLETPSDIVGDDLEAGTEAPGPTEGAGTDEAGESTAEPAAAPAAGDPDQAAAGDGGADEEATGADGLDTEPAGTTLETANGPEPTPDADEDDGVILDDGAEGPEREPGEWPEEDGDEEGDGEDEPAVAEWPDEADGEDDDWAPETEPDPDADRPEDVEPTSTAVTVPEGTFHCPECGFSTPVEASSLRAGDFCPECHRGSLEHRT